MGKVKGLIYKIVDLRTENIVYIGSSTAAGFPRRFYAHYYNAMPERIHPKSQKISKHICAEGPRNFDIVEIEQYECGTGRELVARETHWIKQHNPVCNVNGK